MKPKHISLRLRPENLNDQGKLFGGNALKWMDEVAYLAASRFTGQSMVTAAIEKVKFRQAILLGSAIRITAKILAERTVKLNVSVEIHVGNVRDHSYSLAVEGIFTLVAVDESGNLIRLTGNPGR